jgi:hypothetical protein
MMNYVETSLFLVDAFETEAETRGDNEVFFKCRINNLLNYNISVAFYTKHAI